MASSSDPSGSEGYLPNSASVPHLLPSQPQPRRKRISEKAAAFFQRGGRQRRATTGPSSETASIISAGSDWTPRGSVDSRDAPQVRGLAYQSRIRSRAPGSSSLANESSIENSPSNESLANLAARLPQSSSQNAQQDNSLQSRLQALLQHDDAPTTRDLPVPPLPAEEPSSSRIHFAAASGSQSNIADSPSRSNLPCRPRHHRKDNSHGLFHFSGSSHRPGSLHHRRSTSFSTTDGGQKAADAEPVKKKQKKVKRGAVPVIPPLATSEKVLEEIAAVSSPASSRPSSGPSRTSSMATSAADPRSPLSSSSEETQKLKLQRPNIKVRIITWNMHDSLPKGDLEILLGKTGIYIPPEDGWDVSAQSDEEADNNDNETEAEDRIGGEDKPAGVVDEGETEDAGIARPKAKKGKYVVGQEAVPRQDRIPPLPFDDAHPYHILVVAGQECPWGDGKRLATGVGMANELGDIGKQKARTAAQKEKDKKDKEEKEWKDKEKKPDKKGKDKDGDGSQLTDDNNDRARTATQTSELGTEASEVGGFPFHLPPLSQGAFAGGPLLSPPVGSLAGASFGAGGGGAWTSGIVPSTPGPLALVEGLGEKVNSAANGLAGGWGGLGGKGWSDMCEDWFCKGLTPTQKEKEKLLLSNALLPKALIHSPSKKDLATQRHLSTGIPSRPNTPDLSHAASPDPLWSQPSTPGPSTPLTQGADPRAGTSPSLHPVWKLKKDLPLLRLKVNNLNDKTDGQPRIQSPTESSSAINRPKSPLFTSKSKNEVNKAKSVTIPTSQSGGMLAVPAPPAFSRNNSSSSVAKTDAGDGSEDAEASTHASSRSPSPYIYPAQAPTEGTPGQAPAPAFIGLPPLLGTIPSSEAVSEQARSAKALREAHFEDGLPDGTPKSLGPYQLVIKERMMGCYMAVYVWRGCKDRIRGVSRSHVKSGLLAGRVGNKGGVGISVKLGATRLLFVNAHLAAHEGKVALRLSNVAKIKAALKVDSFLPKGDPRAEFEDITEQFDHCFWFGDLNFRIDISRQHADWLLMHKKYDQALAFDQLGKVLKEGDAFKGFKEAPILFPPTYKYDVLKTLKPKRNKTVTQRILHRRTGSKTGDMFQPLAESAAEGGEGGQSVDAELNCGAAADSLNVSDPSFVPTTLDAAISEDSAFQRTASRPQRKASRAQRTGKAKLERANAEAGFSDGCGTLTDDDTSSISSSACDSVASSSGFAGTLPTGDNEPDPNLTAEARQEAENQRIVEENTQAAQGPKVFSQGAAIKAKLRILDFVRSATGQKGSGPSNSANSGTGPKSGRTRSSTKGSAYESGGAMEYVPAASLDIGSPLAKRRSAGQRMLDSSVAGSSPVESSGSGGSIVSHSPSKSSLVGLGTSVTTYASTPTSEGQDGTVLLRSTSQSTQIFTYNSTKPYTATAEQLQTLEEQPYDTSAKQRVPSWCDRVLFRSTVPMEEDSDDEDGGEDANGRDQKKSAHEGRLGSRVSTALSNALINPLRQAAERRQAQRQASTLSALIAAAAASSSITFAEQAPSATLIDPSLKSPRRAKSTTAVTTVNNVDGEAAPSSPSKGKSTLLFQRLLHPGRHSKALKPSRTIELDHNANGGGLSRGSMMRALSAVDLPSQVEVRDKEFGLLEPTARPSPALEPLMPPRQSSSAATSASSKPVYESPAPSRPGMAPRSLSAELLKLARSNKSGSPTSPADTRPSVISRMSSKGNTTSEAHGGSAEVSPVNKENSLVSSSPAGHEAHSSFSSRLKRPSLPKHGSSSNSEGLTGYERSQSVHDSPVAEQVDLVTTDSNADGVHPRSGTSWWMDHLSQHLPSFLTPAFTALRGTEAEKYNTSRNDADTQDSVALVGPKKGRVECLLYKSLDDREMRILEGRSDHRPVIFVGAIGI